MGNARGFIMTRGGVDASLLWHGGIAAALLSAFDPLFGSVHLACVKKEVFMNAI